MGEHPIQGLMKTAMENIREMVDVNTIIGDPIETPDGSVILPVSKVGFGFAAGGTEFESYKDGTHQQNSQSGVMHGNSMQSGEEKGFPFGGGSGGGISITPVAFLVVNRDGIRTVSLREDVHLYDRLLDMAPAAFDKIKEMFDSCQVTEKKKSCRRKGDKPGNHVIDDLVWE
ncbi:sporulation protein YtfJ [Aneurinibacillus soli]|uniref:Putative spore protein YtfJ n=1 Tax=Aneurinibacillus soli TaxID=1500254 RepID=A0A0U5BC98_9BACL|nr:GerW family sporulation protein [Aneurinibacillus soli]PYE57242.1 sporulation protein YtfJ [Aneurinibacillus soli]BAU29238.1 putative spore protein YtfJ [Aneurinibacillus soli]